MDEVDGGRKEAATKMCRKCLLTKDRVEFNRYKAAPDGMQYWCRACARSEYKIHYRANAERINAKSRAWSKANPHKTSANMRRCRAGNPEHFRKYVRDYRKQNPEKAAAWDRNKRAIRRAAITATVAKLTRSDWEKIKIRHKHRCFYCNRKSRRLTMDHYMPLSRGGDHSKDNIVPACSLCNGRKTNLDPKVFALRQGRMFW